jgi:hypothetical protein
MFRPLVPFLLLAGCGRADGPDRDLDDPASLEGFLRDLPAWDVVSPPVAEAEAPTGAPQQTSDATASDGTAYHCVSTEVRLDTNPDQFAMVSPDAAVLWPGALLRGASHLDLGSLELLAVDRTRRAPLGISVQGGGVLGIPGGVSTVVAEPVGSTVREGINQIVAQALAADVAVGAGKSSFTSVETHSAEQSVLALGFDARYLGASVQGSLSTERAADEHTLTATFVQTLFTVAVDPPESPAGVFAETVTPADLVALGVGADNLPLYIDSVSYGRMVMLSVTSTASISEIEAALEAGYSGFGVDVGGYAASELQETLQSAKIEVFALGGPNAGVESLVTSGQLADYFDVPLEINQVEPISFTVRNLGDNRLATVAAATEYDIRTCEALTDPPPAPVHWWTADGHEGDEVGDHDLSFGGAYAAGASGQAWSLDGEGDYLMNHLAGLAVPDDGPFTISAWVLQRDDARYHTIASQLSEWPLAGELALRIGPGGVLQLFRRPADDDVAVDLVESPPGAVPERVWTHVIGAYGAGPDGEAVMRLYVNGELVSGGVTASGYSPARGELYFRVGASELSDVVGENRFHLYGDLDELKVFDVALSSSEALALYATE